MSPSKDIQPIQASRKQRLIVSCVGAVMALAGFAMATYGVLFVVEAQGSVQWPTVQGEIVRSEVARIRYSDGLRYEPDVHYRYEVDGVSHEGTRISFNERSRAVRENNEYDVKRLVNMYPLGEICEVHYDPSDAANATLEAGVGKYTFVWLAAGFAFATFGVSIVFFTFPFRSKGPQAVGCLGLLAFVAALGIAIWTML